MGCDMYEIGICDDGVNTCTEIENLLLTCAKEKRDSLEYTGLVYRGGIAQLPGKWRTLGRSVSGYRVIQDDRNRGRQLYPE